MHGITSFVSINELLIRWIKAEWMQLALALRMRKALNSSYNFLLKEVDRMRMENKIENVKAPILSLKCLPTSPFFNLEMLIISFVNFLLGKGIKPVTFPSFPFFLTVQSIVYLLSHKSFILACRKSSIPSCCFYNIRCRSMSNIS